MWLEAILLVQAGKTIKIRHVCGHKLPENLKLAQKLDTPLFTPASKSLDGHDENISIKEMENQIGVEKTKQLQDLSMSIYNRASNYANERGIIIADTKFEFGLLNDEIIIIGEEVTPDSQGFWRKIRMKWEYHHQVLISRL